MPPGAGRCELCRQVQPQTWTLVTADNRAQHICRGCWWSLPQHQTARAESQATHQPVGTHRQSQHVPHWQLLPDEQWAHIVSFLGTYDKLNLERACPQFNRILSNPLTRDTWGRLTLREPRVMDGIRAWSLCEWLQRRLAGMSAICLSLDGFATEHVVMSRMWHTLVASTSGTDIRLRLSSTPAAPSFVLAPPLHAELVQRLTALDVCVASASEVAAVHSLTALRHPRLCDDPDASEVLLAEGAGSDAQPCQLSSLRTLQLHGIPPAAFFTPGSAAGLQQLHTLSLDQCQVPDVKLPAELLRLPFLNELVILNVPGALLVMPDLRGLAALQTLVIFQGPPLEVIRDTTLYDNDTDLEASLAGGPLCGATGLTRLCLSSTPIRKQECAEAIERLPLLKVLRLDYSSCDEAAFWAASLQRRLRGRCDVQPARPCRIRGDWVGDDW